MPHDFTIYEIREVQQLLAFKTADLIKSNLFTETIKDDKGKKILEKDMELSCVEIKDLENLLIPSA